MGTQSTRQAARRAALDSQARLRKECAEAERRASALGVGVMVALGERDTAIELHDRRAGEALRKLTRDEGLSLPQAVNRCGDLTVKEARRLWRVVKDDASDDHEPAQTAPDIARALSLRWHTQRSQL